MAVDRRELPTEDLARSAPPYRTLAARTAVVTGVVLLVVAVASVVWNAPDVLLLVFAGILAGIFLHGLAAQLTQRTPLGYGWALGTVMLLLIGLAVGLGWLLAPQIASQSRELAERLPQAMEQLQGRLTSIGWAQQMLDRLPAPQKLLGRADILSRATGLFSTTFGLLVNVLLVAIVGVYLAATPGLYQRGLLQLIPRGSRGRAGEIMGDLGSTLWWWMIGQLSAMTLVGVLVFAGLSVLQVPFAATLGLLAALLDFVPNFGPWLAAAPAIMIALLQSPEQALYVVLLYTAVQFLEGFLITPMIQQKVTEVPPALLICAQVLLGVLVGGLGLALATPLLAATILLVRKLYVENYLEERS